MHKCVSSNANLFNHSNKLNFNVIICTENGSSAGFQITDENDEIVHWVDAADPARSNWLRYINSPLTEDEANLDMVQFKDDIYYQVIDAIPEGKKYANMPMQYEASFKSWNNEKILMKNFDNFIIFAQNRCVYTVLTSTHHLCSREKNVYPCKPQF